MNQQENKGWGEKIDEWWNEHDGDHFYKDELKDVVKEICRLQKERLIKEVESLKGLNRMTKDEALEDILRRLQSV